MANRQSRSPGELRQYQGLATISGDVPSLAIDQGAPWRALEQVGGQLAGRLMKLANEAAAREEYTKTLSDVQRGGASYLEARAVEERAAAAAGSGSRQINAPASVRDAISQAAKKHGVDPAALMRIAEIESSLNPNAKNPKSSAGGLFQFIDSTAAQYGLANRFDPHQAADAGARLMKDNAAYLRAKLGREPSAGELYLAHQQGADGAVKLLANPNASAAGIVGNDAIRLNGGHAGMTAGEFAGLWTRKAGGASAAGANDASQHYSLATIPTEPLALRNDGTIRGNAHDEAAISAYGWRMQQGLSTDLANAHDEFENDPAGFQKRLAEIHAHYLQDENLGDPRLREAFDKNFATVSQGFVLDVADKHGKRILAEQQQAMADGLSAQAGSIERQAYLLGANPDGSKIIGDQLGRALNSIDSAVARGTMTPEQASAAREKLNDGAFNGQVQGVYAALDTPEKKEAFALSLLDTYAKGDDPLFNAQGLNKIQALSDTLRRDAQQLRNDQSAKNVFEKQRVSSLIDDDVASMAATGKGLDLKEGGLDPALVVAALGEQKALEWQDKRALAGKTWEATAGMEAQSDADIAARLAMLEPKAGQKGYAEARAIYEAAEANAERVIKKRADDPLGQADAAGLVELAPIDPSSPETLASSLNERKSQAALVAGALQSPVPLFRPEEVKVIKGSLGTKDPARHGAVMAQLEFQAQQTGLKDVGDTFGQEAVTALQDWQARVRYFTPEETAQWLKDRSDPQWQERIKPLVSKGETEARKVKFEDVAGLLDEAFFYSPSAPLDADTKQMMLNDFVMLTGQRYAVSEDMGVAKEQAADLMKKRWGATGVYGKGFFEKGYGGRLMAYPPEEYYPPVAQGHGWLAEEFASLAAARGVAVDDLALVSDGKTKAAADRGEAPGYLLSKTDPDTGLSELLTDDKGRVLRHFFDPALAQKTAQGRAEEARRVKNDPWLVLSEGTSVGPLYRPWAPATAADMNMRKKRIREILDARKKARAAEPDPLPPEVNAGGAM